MESSLQSFQLGCFAILELKSFQERDFQKNQNPVLKNRGTLTYSLGDYELHLIQFPALCSVTKPNVDIKKTRFFMYFFSCYLTFLRLKMTLSTGEKDQQWLDCRQELVS